MATVRSVVVRIGADISQFSREMQRAGNQMQQAGGKLTSIGKGLTATVTAPIVAIGAVSLKSAMQFEKSMSGVQAVTGATGTELKQLSDKAKEMGASTSKSATDAADAVGYMGLAGFKTTQIMGALEPVLRLSEAGNLDLARTADLVTDSMSALGLKTNELGGFLDMVAQTSRKSNTDVSMLMEAFVLVGGSLKSLNIPLDESNALLGILANRGIKGAEAGNSLSSILINLTTGAGKAGTAMKKLNFSAFDSEGKFKGMSVVLKELNGLLKDGTEEQVNLVKAMIGGKTQVSTLNALLDGMSMEYDELKGQVSDSSGALEEMASVMQDNLTGQLTKTKSALEGVAIQIGDILIPIVNDLVVNYVMPAVAWFANLDDGSKKLALKIALVAAAIGPVILVVGGLITGAGALTAAFGTLTATFGAALPAVALGVVAFTAWGVAAYQLLTNFRNIRDGAAFVFIDIKRFVKDAITASKLEISKLTEDLRSTLTVLGQFSETAKVAGKALETAFITTAEDARLEFLANKLQAAADKAVILKNNITETKEEEAQAALETESLNETIEQMKLGIVEFTDKLKKSSDSIKGFNSDNVVANKTLANMKTKLKEAQDQMKDNIAVTTNLGNAIVTALKNKYKKASEAQKDAIEDELDREKTKHEKIFKMISKSLDREIKVAGIASRTKIKGYNDELAAKIKTLSVKDNQQITDIEGKISAIENATKAEEKLIEESEHNKLIAEKNANIESIKEKVKADQNKIKITEENAHLVYNMYKDIIKKGESDIAKEKEEIAEIIAERERKLLLESRDAKIEAYQKEIEDVMNKHETEVEALEKQFEIKKSLAEIEHDMLVASLKRDLEAEKTSYASSLKEVKINSEEKLEVNKTHYENLMKEDVIQNDARKLLLSKNQDEVVFLLETYNKDWQNAGQSFGEAMLKGLNSQKESIRAVVQEIGRMVSNVSGTTLSTSGAGIGAIDSSSGTFMSGSPLTFEQMSGSKKGNVTVNVTGNTISNGVEVDLIGDSMISKLRTAGVMK